MVASGLAGQDQIGHHGASHGRIFELVAAGANRHIEAIETRSVVYWNPVVRNVVQFNNTLHAAGRNRQRRDPLGLPIYLRRPLICEFSVKVVRMVLSDKCEPVSEWRKYCGFMQHKVAATRQEQLHVESYMYLENLGDVPC